MSTKSIRDQSLIILANLASSPQIAEIIEHLEPLPSFLALRACIVDLVSNMPLVTYIISNVEVATPIPDALRDDVHIAFVATRLMRGESRAQILEAWSNLGRLYALMKRITPAEQTPRMARDMRAKPIEKSAPSAPSAPATEFIDDFERAFIESATRDLRNPSDVAIITEQYKSICDQMRASAAHAARPPTDEERESRHIIVEEGPYDYSHRGIHMELAQACIDARGKLHEPLEGEEEDLVEKLSTEEIARWEKEIAEEKAKQAKQAKQAQKVHADRARLDGPVPISGIYQNDPAVDMMKQEVAEFRVALVRDEEMATRDSRAPDPRMPKLGVKLGPQRQLVLAPPLCDYASDMVSRCLEYHTTDHEVAAAEAAVRADAACGGSDGVVAKAECKCDQASAPAYADDTFNAYRRDLVYGDSDTTEAELLRMCAHKTKRPRKADESLADITDDDVMREMARVTRECLAKDRARLALDEADSTSLAKISDEAIMREMMSRAAHVHDDIPEKPRGPPTDVVGEMMRDERAKALPDIDRHIDAKLARVIT